MGIEKAAIMDLTSDGGVIGMTQKSSSMLQWSLTRHLIGQYSAVVIERSGISSVDGNMKDVLCTGEIVCSVANHSQALHNHLEKSSQIACI